MIIPRLKQIMLNLKLNIIALLSVGFVVVLAACHSGTSTDTVDRQNENVYISLIGPASMTGPLIPELKAFVILDGGEPIELIVNPDNTIRGSKDTHNFFLQFSQIIDIVR